MTFFNEKKFTEEELIIYVGALDIFETKAWIKNKCLKKDNGTHKKLIAEAECHADDVTMEGKGTKRVYTLIGLKDIPEVRQKDYKGTVSTGNQDLMKEIIFNELLKTKDKIKKHETGLSYNGWATLCGIYNIPEQKGFHDELIGVIQNLHKLPVNNSFKPEFVVEEFERAILRARKSAPKNAFNALVTEKKIRMEAFKMKAVTSGKNEVVVNDEYEEQEEGLKYEEIPTEEYELMIAARMEVLESCGVSLTEYNNNINKKNRSKSLNRAFRAVKKRLKDEFGAIYMFESYKIEIIDDTQKPNPYFEDVNGCFFTHFQKLVRDRQNREDYKTSTYFWRRFYLWNTSVLLEHIGYINGIDGGLYQQEKENYQDNLKAYQYDFKGYEFKKEIISGSGFFGNMEVEAKRRQDEWLMSIENEVTLGVNEQLGDFFDNITPISDNEKKSFSSTNDEVKLLSTPVILSDYSEEVNGNAEEFTGINAWLNKFDGYKNPRRAEVENSTRTKMSDSKKPVGWIDIGAIWDEPTPEPVKRHKTRIFGCMFDRNLPVSIPWTEEEQQMINESNESLAEEYYCVG